MIFSPRHEAMLLWAGRGVKVFPIKLGTKDGMLCHWPTEATTDPAVIDGWFQTHGDVNVGLKFEQHCACDPDDAEGQASYDALGADRTYTQRTPGGGRHYVFAGHLPNTVGAFGPSLDTRGPGGFILAAPSVIGDKEYTVEIDQWPPAPLPRKLAERVAARERETAERPSLPAVEGFDPIVAHNQAVAYLKAHPHILSGNRNHEVFQVMAQLRDWGIEHEDRVTLTQQYLKMDWDGFDEAEVRKCSASADRNARNGEPATEAPLPVQTLFAHALAAHGVDASQAPPVPAPPRPSRFAPRDRAQQRNRQPPTWLVPRLLPQRALVLLYGPSGAGKSLVSQEILMAVSANVETFGSKPLVHGPVIYAALEGLPGVETVRAAAWETRHGVEAVNFYTCPAPLYIIETELEEFRAEMRKLRPILIVFDTVAKMMVGLKEDASDYSKLANFGAQLVEEIGCTVIFLGHTGKNEENGHRGSNALGAACDTRIRITGNIKSSGTLRVFVEHQRDHETEGKPFYFIVKDNVLCPSSASEVAGAEEATKMAKRHSQNTSAPQISLPASPRKSR